MVNGCNKACIKACSVTVRESSQDLSELYARLRHRLEALAKGVATIARSAPENEDRTRALSHRARLTRLFYARGMILELPRLSCTAGTHDHAWQASRTRYGRAAMAVRALNSLRGCRGSGPFIRLRTRVVQVGRAERRWRVDC